jgi:hypothetical protein
MFLSCPARAQPQTSTAPVPGLVKLRPAASADTQPRPLFPRVPLTLRKESPTGTSNLPKLSKAGRYASVRAGGRDLLCAFDAPEGSFALGLLYTGGKKPVTGRAQPTGKSGFRILFGGVSLDGVKLNIVLEYRGTTLVGGMCQPAFHRRGKAVFEGVVREVMLVDGDGDGRFDGVEDRWLALLPERARRVASLRRPAMMRLNEPQVPFDGDGTALMVHDVASDGSSLKLRRAKPNMPLDRVLARRYAEYRAEYFRSFGRERDAFTRRAGIDPDRRRVKSTAVWPRIPLEEAMTRAKKTGRPLLVAHYTETNVWWWRYLYYTFPDRDVDRLLHRFVRTAIDAEKAGAKSFQKSGAKSLPALQAFAPDGTPIRFNFLARDEKGKVRELGPTTAGVTGWQKPADLAENLKRMLGNG